MNRIVIYSWRRLGIGPKRWDFRVVSSNGQPVGTSHRQGYNDAAEAERMGRRLVDGTYRDAAGNVKVVDRA